MYRFAFANKLCIGRFFIRRYRLLIWKFIFESRFLFKLYLPPKKPDARKKPYGKH